MVQINFAKREVQCKVVYYGPEMGGKTTNLRQVYEKSPQKVRGNLTTIATDTQRTLFFDFLPLNLGLVAKVKAKINLYAIPYIEGQNALRLLVLEGVDGIVFVADSAPDQVAANREALENLHENLNHLGRDLRDIPLVFQWNKRDREDAVPVEQLQAQLNPSGLPAFEATAETGHGIFNTLKAVTHGVLLDVSKIIVSPAAEVEPVPEVPATRARPLPAPEPAPEPLQAPEPAPYREPLPPPEPATAPAPAAAPDAPVEEPVPAAVPISAVKRQRRDLPTSSSFLGFDDNLPSAGDAGPERGADESSSSVVPPWRQAPEPKPAVSQGANQFQFQPPEADSNAGQMDSAMAEPYLAEDVPRAADLDAEGRTPNEFHPGETETALVEPLGGSGGGWDPEILNEPANDSWDVAPEPGPYEPDAYEPEAYEPDAYEPEPYEPAPSGRVRVGGPRMMRGRSGWDTHTSDIYGGIGRRHDARPVVDRRRKPRLDTNIETLSTANLVAGSLFALFTLIVVGVLVHQLL